MDHRERRGQTPGRFSPKKSKKENANNVNNVNILERETLINSLSVPVQQLIINLYGSIDDFVKTKKVDPLEEYILRFDKYCGYEDHVESISREMNISLKTQEPALELYNYLNYLTTNKKESVEFLNPN